MSWWLALTKKAQPLLPPRCLLCLKTVEQSGTLCANCWPQLSFISHPLCDICGLAFEYEMGEGGICVFCSQKKPSFERCRSALVYDEHSKPLVLGFKHNDSLWGVSTYAQWMAKAGQDVLKEAELLLPVPLHWTRLLSRRYNQAALLVNALADFTGVDRNNHVLKRRRATPSQGRRNRAERLQNVRKAFLVPDKEKPKIQDKICVLVDDVYTTGATVDECSQALFQAGAASVRVLTLARVV